MGFSDDAGKVGVGAINGNVYHAEVSANRPASDYTARLISHRDGVAALIGMARVLWRL